MHADELLSEVDSLPYHRRMATLARHARMLADDRPGVPPLLAAAETLAASSSAASGLLALALAEQGAAFGWPEPWRDLVDRLRGHPNADVRSSALDLDLTS